MLSGIDNLGLFIVTGMVLNLTPGPDVLYIMTQALKHGGRAGAVAALGITAGCLVHVGAATLGLSALMAASGSAFFVVKWLGAAYLVFAGCAMLGLSGLPGIRRTPDLIAGKAASTGASGQFLLKNVWANGFWTNVLNPKVALFFLAFLPQFIVPTAPHGTFSFLLLGLLFTFNSLWVNLGYAAVGAYLSQRVAALQHAMQWLERVAAALFIGFGLKLALMDNPST